jgi:hypothetical protein
VLLQLPGSCTSLHVGGAAFTDAACAVLLQLTQLRDVGFSWCPEFTDVGLEQLTQLDLQRCVVYNCGVSQQVCPDDLLELRSDPHCW